MNAVEAAHAALKANPAMIADAINENKEVAQNEEAITLLESLKTAIERFATDEDKAVSFYRSILSTVDGETVIKSLDHFVPSQGFDTVEQFTARLDLLKERASKAEQAEHNAEVAKAAIEARNAAITTAKGQLLRAIKDAAGTSKKMILPCVSVDTFINVTNYENNRDVEARAIKQAKAVKQGKDTSTHQTGDQVAIALLDPERNKTLWERTVKVAEANGVPHTLPFIKVDGHTRAYAWATPYTKDANQTLFSRPESLFITVYQNQTDGEIYQLVQDYCNGVNKATNGELQQMGMKKIEFAPVTAFVAKDSWKTAFRTIDREYGQNTDKALEEFREELEAIDNLKIETKNTTKKLSGVRAALITTYTMSTKTKWKEFWSRFYATKCKSELIIDLVAELGEMGTGDAVAAKAACEQSFKEFAGITEQAE